MPTETPQEEVIRRASVECSVKLGDIATTEAEQAAKIRGPLRRFRLIFDTFRRLVGSREQVSALEIGVGEGTLLVAGVRLFPHVDWWGAEIPGRHSLHPEAARDLFGSLQERILECDLNEAPLPFGDERFDFAFLSEVVEHLPPNALLPTLREAYRVLRPGGHLLITTPNLTSLMNRLLLLGGFSPFHLPIPEEEYGCKTYPHIHLYIPGEIEVLGRRVGFRPRERRYLTYLTYAFFGARPLVNLVLRAYLAVEQLLGVLVPSLRDGWMVVLKKAGPAQAG